MTAITDYYQYSQLANAAYVNLDNVNSGSADDLVFQANDQKRIPTNLAQQLFNPNFGSNTLDSVWSIPTNGYYGNDATGFAATLYEKNGEKVLAIRGTESGSIGGILDDLLNADLAQIGFIGFALDQTVSMINYILRLRGAVNKRDRFI